MINIFASKFLPKTDNTCTFALDESTLTLSGHTIHSLKELREKYDSKDLLKAHMEGTLYNWLVTHYYETEADAIQNITIDEPNCLNNLCMTLGIPITKEESLSVKEKEYLNARKQLISSLTDNAEILENIPSVALNQEELASLLNKKIDTIYLGKEEFSIPIKVPGIKYIGFAGATISNPYTAEQYQKADIHILGIHLAENVNPNTKHIAKAAAKASGYDDFYENHTAMTGLFYKHLNTDKIYSYYRLPHDTSKSGKFYSTKYECEKARNSLIDKAYETAEKYVTIGSSKSIAKKAAHYYSDIIYKTVSPYLENLKKLAKLNNAFSAYAELEKLVLKSYKSLLEVFENELIDSSDYYKMYEKKYFIEQSAIETHDFRVAEEDHLIMRTIETLFADNVQYTISNIFDTIQEMEKDLNEHTSTFWGVVHNEYLSYVSEIFRLLDMIGQHLTVKDSEETLHDFLIRSCVELAS